jgi:hypothetical protein
MHIHRPIRPAVQSSDHHQARNGRGCFRRKLRIHAGKGDAAGRAERRNRLNYVLHGGGWVSEPTDDASPNKAEMDRRARNKRKAEVLDAMKPGKEYLARDLAETLGWHPKTIGSTLKALRLLGKVTSRVEK